MHQTHFHNTRFSYSQARSHLLTKSAYEFLAIFHIQQEKTTVFVIEQYSYTKENKITIQQPIYQTEHTIILHDTQASLTPGT